MTQPELPGMPPGRAIRHGWGESPAQRKDETQRRRWWAKNGPPPGSCPVCRKVGSGRWVTPAWVPGAPQSPVHVACLAVTK